MNRIYLIIAATFFAVMTNGCNGNQEKFFDDEPTLYFKLTKEQQEGIALSFAKTTGKEMTYELPIEISGYSSPNKRIFKVVVDRELTTAKEGEHYKPLEKEYFIEANRFTANVPLTFYCTDPNLDNEAVELVVKIEESVDFGNGLVNRQSCKLSISNVLLKPGSWDGWWSRSFGVYSKVKHKIILEQCNISEVPDKPESGSRYKWQGFGNVVLNYCKENYPIYDENHQIIEPNWTIKY